MEQSAQRGRAALLALGWGRAQRRSEKAQDSLSSPGGPQGPGVPLPRLPLRLLPTGAWKGTVSPVGGGQRCVLRGLGASKGTGLSSGGRWSAGCWPPQMAHSGGEKMICSGTCWGKIGKAGGLQARGWEDGGPLTLARNTDHCSGRRCGGEQPDITS